MQSGLINVEFVRAHRREIDRRHQRMHVEPRGGPPRKRRDQRY
jgi:hypothetical protein